MSVVGGVLKPFFRHVTHVNKTTNSNLLFNISRLWLSNINVNFKHKMPKNQEKGNFKFLDYDCIGFDLDNTLARYKVGAMIEMEYDIVAKFLVFKKGYSEKHLLKPLDHNFIMKGLIIDDENGNIVRLGPDGKILQASHGSKLLNDDQILKYYPDRHWEPTDLFTKDPLCTWNGEHATKMRALLDYFDIIASIVFARAVDTVDEEKGVHKHYNVYEDIVAALQDMFDREHFGQNKGDYFRLIKDNPEKYYYKCSNDLLNWLQELKKRGKVLFLITGSHTDFANHTASNTLGENWKDLFDIIVCFAKKPGFFTMNRDFLGVDGLDEKMPVPFEKLQAGEMYTHGNWKDLHAFLLSICDKEDPKFVYVGDNLVQDVYTPHVHSQCDTVAVCEELEAEGVHGHEPWHPDEQFLVSTVWGSYFHCNKNNSATNWYHMMKTHSKLCVPSLEYVATYPIDYVFKTQI
ncbi:unnamed protein product [Brassicogethes aeneus]|uniref:5'-nucleotidase domain-containing protein 1 n=1 Tax=Brassicogethes aeneus TaxID=1431903 RepID=A0A9P0BHS6_BRAAE|nr:unnamed protein product [Brassicogethes aeneus]